MRVISLWTRHAAGSFSGSWRCGNRRDGAPFFSVPPRVRGNASGNWRWPPQGNLMTPRGLRQGWAPFHGASVFHAENLPSSPTRSCLADPQANASGGFTSVENVRKPHARQSISRSLSRGISLSTPSMVLVDFWVFSPFLMPTAARVRCLPLSLLRNPGSSFPLTKPGRFRDMSASENYPRIFPHSATKNGTRREKPPRNPFFSMPVGC